MACPGWSCSFSGPWDEKSDFRYFHCFGYEPASGLCFFQLNTLHSSLGLEPRIVFILQEPAADVARRVEPQRMTSSLAITAMGQFCKTSTVSSWSGTRMQGETLTHRPQARRLLQIMLKRIQLSLIEWLSFQRETFVLPRVGFRYLKIFETDF